MRVRVCVTSSVALIHVLHCTAITVFLAAALHSLGVAANVLVML